MYVPMVQAHIRLNQNTNIFNINDNDDKEACAAALLYFGLHEATTVNYTNDYHDGNAR